MFSLPLSTLDQQKMIALLKKKDKQGFDLLYDAYSVALYGVGLHITGDEKLAEQVVENAFVFLWKNIHTYNSAQLHFDVWLLSIVKQEGYRMNLSANTL